MNRNLQDFVTELSITWVDLMVIELTCFKPYKAGRSGRGGLGRVLPDPMRAKKSTISD